MHFISPTDKPVVVMWNVNIDSQKNNDYTHMSCILNGHNIQWLNLPSTRITTTSDTSKLTVFSIVRLKNLNKEVLNTRISNHTGQLYTINCESKIPISSNTEQRWNMNAQYELFYFLKILYRSTKVAVDARYDELHVILELIYKLRNAW